jgi:cobalt/nickel transport system permease protein
LFLIDQYAYTNKLNDVHPVEKTLFSMLTMGVAIVSNRFAIHILIILLMFISTVIIARIPIKVYTKLILIPLAFLIIGVIPIIFTVSSYDSSFIYSIKISNLYLGITKSGIESGFIVCLRSIATITCLYFMSLTTPLLEVIQLLRKLKLPKSIIEIMTLIYRFIFVLLESAVVIHNSQSSRLGYSSVGNSFKSMGKLTSMVFIKAYNNSQSLYQSLVSRGYNGDLNVISREYSYSIRNICLIFAVEILFIVLVFLMGSS